MQVTKSFNLLYIYQMNMNFHIEQQDKPSPCSFFVQEEVTKVND